MSSNELSFSLSELGSTLCEWHSGMDAIYAVGSFAIDGRVHPDRDTIERCQTLIEREFTQGHPKEYRRQLAWIACCLDEILTGLPPHNEYEAE